jgi:hypothetical protein
MAKHKYPKERASVTFAVDEKMKIAVAALELIAVNSPDPFSTSRAHDIEIAKIALKKING